MIEKVSCPTLFVHGKKDELIHHSHSEDLMEKCNSQIKQLVVPENMTHNEFDLYRDLVRPV